MGNLQYKTSPPISDSQTTLLQTTSQRPIKSPPQNAKTIKLRAQPIEPKPTTPHSAQTITSPTTTNNEDVVNAYDGRTRILATAEWPYSAHGVVVFKINGERKWGTGIMIGPNAVLTAGHVVFNFQLKAKAHVESMQFLPGMNVQELPFGPVEVEECLVSPNYIKEEKEDYALLILKQSIGELTGYFGLACLEPEEIKKKRLNVTGFPSDKVKLKPSTYEMWGMEGQAAYIDQARGYIHYLIDTATGQSGSGVWYKEGENYYVCGVHISGDWQVNRATLLTRNAYNQIHQWLQEVNLKKLKNPKSLSLGSWDLNVNYVSLMMENENLYDLEYLSVTPYDVVNAEGVRALAGNTSWNKLFKLEIYRGWIGIEGAKALAQNISWVNLSELDLRGNSIEAEGIKALVQNKTWVNLSNFI